MTRVACLSLLLILSAVLAAAWPPRPIGDAPALANALTAEARSDRLVARPAQLLNGLSSAVLSSDRVRFINMSLFGLPLPQSSVSEMTTLLRNRIATYQQRKAARKRHAPRQAPGPLNLGSAAAAAPSAQVAVSDWTPSYLLPPPDRNQAAPSSIEAAGYSKPALSPALVFFALALGFTYFVRNARNRNSFKGLFEALHVMEASCRKLIDKLLAALPGRTASASDRAARRAPKRSGGPDLWSADQAKDVESETAMTHHVPSSQSPRRRARLSDSVSSSNKRSAPALTDTLKLHVSMRKSEIRETDLPEPNYRHPAWSGDIRSGPHQPVTAMNDFLEPKICIGLRHQTHSTSESGDTSSPACVTSRPHAAEDTLEMLGYPLQYAQCSSLAMQVTLQLHDSDIEAQNRLKMERLDSAAKFLTLVEQMGAMPYLANLDACGTPFYISKKFESLMGFSSAQWCADRELRIRQIHPDDRDSVLATIHQTVSDHSSFSLDYRLLTEEGAVRWFHDEARVIVNSAGEPLFIQGIILDISESKQAQLELERSHIELQKLIGALDALREKEQKRLAQEMHDDLGQLLAAMKLDLCTLQQRLPLDQPQVSEQLGNLNELVDAMVSSVRRIIADLPPKIMEDRGLFSALAVLASGFEKRHGIVVRLQLPHAEHAVSEHITTPVYRIVQEALNNVVKHADATRVDVSVACVGSYLKVGIRDNGKGMTACDMQKDGSFGLISMRERVNALDGEMEQDSIIGDGTSIRIRIPLTMAQNS